MSNSSFVNDVIKLDVIRKKGTSPTQHEIDKKINEIFPDGLHRTAEQLNAEIGKYLMKL